MIKGVDNTQVDWVGAVVKSTLDAHVWVGIVSGEGVYALASRSMANTKKAVVQAAAREWGIDEASVEWTKTEEGWDAYAALGERL